MEKTRGNRPDRAEELGELGLARLALQNVVNLTSFLAGRRRATDVVEVVDTSADTGEEGGKCATRQGQSGSQSMSSPLFTTNRSAAMNEKSAAKDGNGIAVNKKAAATKSREKKTTVKESTAPPRAVAITSVPEDRARDALVTGMLTFRRITDDWSDVHIDTTIDNFHETTQKHADSLAQKVAKELERYLYSCPPELRILLAGELIRGLLYESMNREFDWEPKTLVPMTEHATSRR